MIKLQYAYGKHQGELYRIWRDYTSFAKDTLDLVAKTAFDNQLPQQAAFLHYGYGVKTNEAGQTGYTNGILGAMNFWLDSFPDLCFEYDTVGDEDEDTAEDLAKRKNFYSWLERFNRVPGLQLFRTSNELWNYYANNDSTPVCPVWEPNVPVPQQVLETYPVVAALLEAGNLLNGEPQLAPAGLWALEQLLSGKEAYAVIPEMQKYAAAPEAAQALGGKIHTELGVVFYAFLTGKFYEEVAEYL